MEITLYDQRNGFRRGLSNTLAYPLALFGSFWMRPLKLDDSERHENGLVVILSGIEGPGVLSRSLVQGLIDAQVSHAIRIVNWTAAVRPAVINLWRYEKNRQKAAEIAQGLMDYQQRFPGRPITLIGHSGGAAMIPFVLEELPERNVVQNAIMIAPALSPIYDLTSALVKVKEKIHHFYSWRDLYFLGFGTLTMGTLDRRFCLSAGRGGFLVPAEDQDAAAVYSEKLNEVPYRQSMMRDWHYGGHLSCMNRVFIERNVAPIILGKHQNHESVTPH
ncbi:MAG: DUF726 domain-containing protein [Planctomycetaceae bacterium]|nr:DUF726 domain-containing protein [Planctomycetaceae bacterium]